LIKTKKLTKKFGDFTAVRDIDLDIHPGEIYGFLGPNGSGKTTTILMLLGILKPTRGEIQLFGETFSPKRLDLKRKFGVVPEKHPTGMWKWMTASEYLKFFADLYIIREPSKRIKRLLEKVGLLDVESKRIKDFSRGMIQKLSIVRALLPDPEILFLDEPISGLDPIGIKQVRNLILSENREGRTIFISSHILSEMEKICHRVAIISGGRSLAEDKMEVLLRKLSKDREIHIDLEEIPDDLEDCLKGLDFILECSVLGSSLVVKVPKDKDYRKHVSQYLIKRGLVPLNINDKSLSLEEAFTTITEENVANLAMIESENAL
jgi:ABC-2 type transport system ATP-binding protein